MAERVKNWFWQKKQLIHKWRRQIIRYRATTTLRRPQMKQYTVSNGGGGVVTKPTGTSYEFDKRSVMITQEICPIRAEISTHKKLGKCIYLLFVWLAVIGFRQNYYYILPYCGYFGAKMSFFHYIINQKRNNFIKHCPLPCTKKPLISEMCIYIKSSLCRWGLGTRRGGGRCSIDKNQRGVGLQHNTL